MASTYTGVPTATESPGVQPAPRAAVNIRLPADGDPENAATLFTQQYKMVADFLAYLIDGYCDFAGLTSFKSLTIDGTGGNSSSLASGILVSSSNADAVTVSAPANAHTGLVITGGATGGTAISARGGGSLSSSSPSLSGPAVFTINQASVYPGFAHCAADFVASEPNFGYKRRVFDHLGFLSGRVNTWLQTWDHGLASSPIANTTTQLTNPGLENLYLKNSSTHGQLTTDGLPSAKIGCQCVSLGLTSSTTLHEYTQFSTVGAVFTGPYNNANIQAMLEWELALNNLTNDYTTQTGISFDSAATGGTPANGFQNSISSGTGNGMWVQFNPLVNGGRWQAWFAYGGTTAAVDTGIAPTLNNFDLVKFEIDGLLNTAAGAPGFNIIMNGICVGSWNVNIPVGNCYFLTAITLQNSTPGGGIGVKLGQLRGESSIINDPGNG